MASDQPTGKSADRATDGMGGKGYYDSHSDAQKDGIRSQETRLRDAARALDLSGRELRIIDYGCGPGRNSMTAFHTVIDEVRRQRPDIPVVTMHNDQIGNDWNDLFANIQWARWLPERYGVHSRRSRGRQLFRTRSQAQA